ncbi:MAG: translocation/assembly module TamB domain-containing protein [Tannerellaceae bacterium]|nr:translocation/assembly module TamB domain-containing protein [Tannerellaceae bacterium]
MLSLFVLFCVVYVTPVVLLNIPYIQQKVRGRVVAELSDRLHVRVAIDHVRIDWLSRLTAESLYIEDERGRVLFEADYVTAGFKPLPALDGKWVFTSIRLFGFSLHLTKDAPGERLNMQFLVDALSGDTTERPSEIDLRINSALIRNGSISYDVCSEGVTPGKFNPSHTGISEISANITLSAFRRDSLNARIRKMSFRESSGFVLERLSCHVAGNRDSLSVHDFDIRLPESRLNITRAQIMYSGASTVGEIIAGAPVSLTLSSPELYLKELAAFVPAFGCFTDPVEFSAEASGYINDMNIGQLTLKYSDKMLFVGKMSLKGITRPDEAYLLGEVNKMYITTEGLSGLLNNFNARPTLPEAIRRLGTIYFSGEISGFFDHLVAYGKLSSSIGSIETDLLFGSDKEKNIAAYIQGAMSSSELLVGELFDTDNPYGVAKFDLSLDARCPVGGYFSGNVKARVSEFDYRNYRYEDLHLSGHFRHNGFDGVLRIDDPNGALYAEGMFRSDKQNTMFNFTADLKHFRPDNLNLYDKLESPEISVSVNADLKGDNIDNIEGSISVDSLSIHTAVRDFFMKELRITASGDAPDKRLFISSDIINGEVSGAYSFASLIPSLLNTFRNYVPALVNTKAKGPATQENNFSLLLTVENTLALSQTLNLPFTLTSPARITGFYNNRFNKFRTEAFLPGFMIGKTMFEACYFTCENPLDRIDLKLRTTQHGKNVRNYMEWRAEAKDNRMESLLDWANNKEQRYEAKLNASVMFVEEKDPNTQKAGLRTEIHIAESPLIINDSIWKIDEAGITVRNGKIAVRDFLVSLGSQHLYIDGTVSDMPGDTLVLDLNEIELSYIFDVLNISALRFGGKATGMFHVNDVYASQTVNGNLYVEDFSFNRVILGDLTLFSQWDERQQGIMMSGNIYADDTTETGVNGYIYPVGVRRGIDLNFSAGNLDIAFLTPFLDNIISGLKGRGTGKVRLFGSFKDIDLDGGVFVRDGGLGINFLNTYYTFSDSIYLSPGSIRAKSLTLHDRYGNTGDMNAGVSHSYFRDFGFDVDIQAVNMLVYDAGEKQRPMIYGTVFSSGTSHIYGNEKVIDFDINMRTETKTAISFNFMGSSTATAYDFITFKNNNAPKQESEALVDKNEPQEEGVEIRANFTLDVTPDATLELIMDPMAGDKIKGYGSGSLQIEYGTKTDLRMYGIFNILNGNYNFSLQQLIRKDFKIRDGSSVSFRGDPDDANLNINAIYSATANIGDLDPTLLEETARTSIPVNCVLMLEGMLRNPSISFDLELPGANNELERKVKSYANTEDMMTRQIVYLLVLNKFHPSDFTQTGRNNEFSAVTSAAISSQISSILSAITDKVQIGTNIRANREDINETEFEMLLSGQLWDNRLLFNGNFGYKNNPNVKNVFVGEFDIEYLLTPSGEFRLKAYNHANDMYRYLKQSLTTQGFGIMYKKDFSTISELFLRRRKRLEEQGM